MKTALTIGFFDGVHLGHQTLLKKLREHPHTTILTFSNHPQSLFHPPGPEPIIPLEEKLALLQPYADELVVKAFDRAFANTPYSTLLSQYNLSHIILGQGSVFGKDRQGDEANVRAYAKALHIQVEYLPKLTLYGEPISSSRIRQALAAGNLTLAQQLLGRKL